MGFSPVERAALVDLLENGDNVPSNIARSTDTHKKSVNRCLINLADRDLVSNKGAGVYKLTPTGREVAQLLADSE